MTIYLLRPLPIGSSDVLQMRMASNLAAHFYLASGGVYTALVVTDKAVSSCLAFSTLPFRAVIFCCTFLKVTFTGRYPAPCSVKLGLSSLNAFAPTAVTQPTYCHILAQHEFFVHSFSHLFFSLLCAVNVFEQNLAVKFTQAIILRVKFFKTFPKLLV